MISLSVPSRRPVVTPTPILSTIWKNWAPVRLFGSGVHSNARMVLSLAASYRDAHSVNHLEELGTRAAFRIGRPFKRQDGFVFGGVVPHGSAEIIRLKPVALGQLIDSHQDGDFSVAQDLLRACANSRFLRIMRYEDATL
jgi:hypothetical protein